MRKKSENISPALAEDMAKKGIDIPLSLEILAGYNAGFYDNVKPVVARGVPPIDGETVVDLRNADARSPLPLFFFDAKKAEANLARFGLRMPTAATSPKNGAVAGFGAAALAEIGKTLLPLCAYGVLNGGHATSYADGKKNLAFGQKTLDALEPFFSAMAPGYKDMPKGIAPAYINPDGSPGASFLELKMRARLLLASEPKTAAARKARLEAQAGFMPLFQMTSTSNDAVLARYYQEIAASPFLAPLAKRLGIKAAGWHTGVQSLIAAYSHSAEGRPKRIFDRAYGEPESSLALPGGHGQSFRVLAPVFRELHARGVRYACLGNVDNLGYMPDPVELAILAISGRPAAFDFAARTAVDVKGGILVETDQNRLTIADIGPAIEFEALLELERRGLPILFNCASGIFDLDYLVPRLGEIAQNLPLRFSDQDKDAGRYSQAEQVTWEVAGILPSFVAFAVNKNERFLAAKLLAETLLTSGAGLKSGAMPEGIKQTAAGLHEGLCALLRGAYAMELSRGKWTPRELLSP